MRLVVLYTLKDDLAVVVTTEKEEKKSQFAW